jgi:hypothetical protein
VQSWGSSLIDHDLEAARNILRNCTAEHAKSEAYEVESYWRKVNPIGPKSCYNEGKRFAGLYASDFILQQFISRENRSELKSPLTLTCLSSQEHAYLPALATVQESFGKHSVVY